MPKGFLVLSRKEHESVTLVLPCGDQIVVNLGRIAGNRATLAIRAPEDVKIVRGELVEPSAPQGSVA